MGRMELDQLERDVSAMLRQRAGTVAGRQTHTAEVVRRARRRRGVNVGVACALVVILVAGGLAASRSLVEDKRVLPAVPVHHNGKLVAVTWRGLTAVTPNGSHVTPFLAKGIPATGSDYESLTWASDGSRLAFLNGAFSPNNGSHLAVFVAPADGSGARKVTDCPGRGTCGVEIAGGLAWSPDGQSIALTGEGLYVVDVGSGDLRKLPIGRLAASPAWSPDGERIAFAQGTRVRTVRADGTELTTLVDGVSQPSSLNWSPDGTRLILSALDGVYVVDTDGSLERVVTQQRGEGPAAASWSPDGRSIAYFTTPKEPGGYIGQLHVVDLASGRDQVLHETPCCIGDWSPPVWSPDGRYVALSVSPNDHPADSGLFLIAADGSGATRAPTQDLLTSPAWQAIP